MATSIVKVTKRKRRLKTATETKTDYPVGAKRPSLSKKALQKLLQRKIEYRPFTLMAETTGTKGNYWKLIYNTPKY